MTPVLLASLLAGARPADDLLPDISLMPGDLADAYVSTSNSEFPAGTRGLRFSTASVNWGPGRYEIRGGEIVGNSQVVRQRVYRTDGTFWDRLAGTFTYHPQHGHIHFDNWTQFKLREVTVGNGVGNVVATGAKTSFCILELRHADSSLPGHNDPPGYTSCGQLQGLRPGWSDIYGASLFGQVIDLTGVPDGIYWLEGTVDPDNFVLESDETNNTVRVQVAIGPIPAAVPDAFEENDSMAVVDARPEGAPNSPNLGLVLNPVQIDNLSMEDSNDWYKVRLHAGVVGSYIQMESPYLRQNDLNMQLYNSNGTVVRSSTGSYNWENIQLSGLAAGTYYIRVYPSGSGNNPRYRLTINPSENHPPVLVMDEPLAGTHFVEKSLETFPVVWNGNDPDLDPKTVSILRSRVFGNAGLAEPIPGYQDMPNAQGSANINTADFANGLWHILGVGSDGGAQTLSWAPGSIYIYIRGDVNEDGHVHMDDYQRAVAIYQRKPGLFQTEPYRHTLDVDENGRFDKNDLFLILQLANTDHD